MQTPLTSRAFGRRMAGAGLVRREARGGGSQGGFARAMRSMGAIAHFDPSYGVTTSASVSQWIDRIAGYTVDQDTAPTRMTFTSSYVNFGGQPAWIGSLANATRMRGAATLAALMDGSAAYTVYIVRRCTTPASAAILSVMPAAGDDYIYFGTAGGLDGAVATGRFESGATTATGVVQTSTDAAVDVHCWSPSNDFTGWTNGGVTYATSTADEIPVCNSISIGALGAASNFDGHIGDIVIFDTVHTNAQRRYVEQLIAAKYGWSCIQGLSGHSVGNYLENAGLTSGIRGSNSTGVWMDVLLRMDVEPTGGQFLVVSKDANNGALLYSSGLGAYWSAGNSIMSAGSGVGIGAADVGKARLLGMAAGPANLVRGFWNGAEVGAGTALTGYAFTAAVPFSVGANASGAANNAIHYSIFGVAGGDVEQVAANHAARAAAIKAAGRFVSSGGVAPTHAWALDPVSATYADSVGSDVLTMTGTLNAAQIIIPVWPW